MKLFIVFTIFVTLASAYPADKNTPQKKPARPIENDEFVDKLSDEVPVKKPVRPIENDEVVLKPVDKVPAKKPVRPIENEENVAVKPIQVDKVPAKKPVYTIENDEILVEKPLSVKKPVQSSNIGQLVPEKNVASNANMKIETVSKKECDKVQHTDSSSGNMKVVAQQSENPDDPKDVRFGLFKTTTTTKASG